MKYSTFDWQRFCEMHSIEYVVSGPSWTAGNINIQCPFCGSADEGHHMGLSLNRPYWHCWRNDKHAGRKPHRLIMRLIGCGYEQAESYIQDDDYELSDFDEAASKFIATDPDFKSVKEKCVEFPQEFRRLFSPVGRAKIYYEYLLSRGFSKADIPALVKRYGIYYCDRGEWRGRIIFPISVNGRMLTWTGRTIYPIEEQRYKSLSHKEGSEPRGLVSIRDVLFNYDKAMKTITERTKWKVIALVEGPFDAVKVDFFGHSYGICSIGVFGTGIREKQLDMLDRVRERCSNMVVVGDKNADANVMDLLSATTGMKIKELPLPRNVKDPGELNKDQVLNLFKDFLTKK